jgi:hypothetical protein
MMMENKQYTIGAFSDGDTGWKVGEPNDSYAVLAYEIHFNDDTECVAEVVHEEADAKLIAAAPNLLDALIYILDNDDGVGIALGYNSRSGAAKAVNKALGENKYSVE